MYSIKEVKFHSPRQCLARKPLVLLFFVRFSKHCTHCTVQYFSLKSHGDREFIILHRDNKCFKYTLNFHTQNSNNGGKPLKRLTAIALCKHSILQYTHEVMKFTLTARCDRCSSISLKLNILLLYCNSSNKKRKLLSH